MKKLSALFILISFFLLASCQHTVSYQLRNNSDYDVILIDSNDVNYPSYFLKAHAWIVIDHTTGGHFVLLANTNPIEVYNSYSYSEVKELNYFNIKICNNTSKTFQLNILNNTHESTKTFTIENNQNTEIKIYANTKPVIELLNDSKKYNNYVFNDDTLVIY